MLPDADRAGSAPGDDVLTRYVPPFDLESDMLFALAVVDVLPLRSAFPALRFGEVRGRVPLLLWFSRIRRIWHGPAEVRSCLDERDGYGYDELTVAVPLPERTLLVPGIYATSPLTLAIGHRYGMPKRPAEMRFAADAERVSSWAAREGARSEVEASLLASGRVLGSLLRRTLPWWSWPARFPSGEAVRARVQRLRRAQLAGVRGTLALPEPWLPEPVRLLPLGLFVPGLRMRLPAPADVAPAPRAGPSSWFAGRA
jgi:hypothetical protein